MLSHFLTLSSARILVRPEQSVRGLHTQECTGSTTTVSKGLQEEKNKGSPHGRFMQGLTAKTTISVLQATDEIGLLQHLFRVSSQLNRAGTLLQADDQESC